MSSQIGAANRTVPTNITKARISSAKDPVFQRQPLRRKNEADVTSSPSSTANARMTVKLLPTP